MIDRKEIDQIAQLSKLSLSEMEIPALIKDITRMLIFADEISSAAESFLAIGDQDTSFTSTLTLDVLREDQPTPSLSPEQTLQNAQGSEQGFFTVRRKPF